jgi:hypothetical protein
LPATSNLFTLNGNDENDPFLNLNNSGSSNLLLGQNEVQEVAVVSNGYTAQYGRQAGVQVDYTTKSGGNAFHGDAAFWYNSSGFNANDWFQKQAEIAGGTPNQQPFAVNHMWAGSVSGPIVKNKLFFFVDQEGLYYALPSVQTVTLPTPTFITAVESNISGNPNTAAELPYYQKMFGLYQGSPYYAAAMTNQTGFCSGDTIVAAGTTFGTGGLPCAGLVTASGVNHNKEWLLTERIDYNISNSDKLFGRFKADHGEQPTSTDLILPKVFSTDSNQPEYEGQINETHVFSANIVNNFILSGLWYSAIFLPDSGQEAVLSTLGFSNVGFADSELSNLGGTSTSDNDFPQGRNSSMAQLTDDLSITRGNHTFKMGVNARRDVLIDYDAQSGTGGGVTFNTFQDFVNGNVIGANGDNLSQAYTTNGDVRFGFYSLGLYFQDEYRVKPNLKLTLAIRGDRNSNPVCSSNCFSRLASPFTEISHDPNIPYNQAINAGTHSAFPSVEKVAWQPRVGFTWSPGGRSTTVLRGGVGIFSDLYQGILMDELIGNSPLTNGFTITPAVNPAICPTTTPTCYTGGAPLAPGTAGGVQQLGANSNASLLAGFKAGLTEAQIAAVNPFFTPPNYTSIANEVNNPKYVEWNFEVQQALGAKMSLNIDYVGTHGYDTLIQNGNLNACVPGGGFSGLPACTASGLAGTDQRFGAVRQLNSNGISNYDGLVTTFTRRFSHGFQGSVNYTWSHALDDLTTTNPGTPFNLFDAQVYQSNPNCLQCQNYGNGDGDARHNLTANYVWDIPFKSANRLLNETIGGWTVAGTFFAHSGLPWTPETFGPWSDGSLTLGFLPALNLEPNANVPSSCQSNGPGSIADPTPCVQASQFAATQTDFGGRRNQFRGLGYFDTDLNVNKRFDVTERVKFEVGASFFNILNHPNFGLPDPYAFTSAFGQMCSASTNLGCNALATQPATPYGSFQGAGVEGRLVQLHGKLTF